MVLSFSSEYRVTKTDPNSISLALASFPGLSSSDVHGLGMRLVWHLLPTIILHIGINYSLVPRLPPVCAGEEPVPSKIHLRPSCYSVPHICSLYTIHTPTHPHTHTHTPTHNHPHNHTTHTPQSILSVYTHMMSQCTVQARTTMTYHHWTFLMPSPARLISKHSFPVRNSCLAYNTFCLTLLRSLVFCCILYKKPWEQGYFTYTMRARITFLSSCLVPVIQSVPKALRRFAILNESSTYTHAYAALFFRPLGIIIRIESQV